MNTLKVAGLTAATLGLAVELSGAGHALIEARCDDQAFLAGCHRDDDDDRPEPQAPITMGPTIGANTGSSTVAIPPGRMVLGEQLFPVAAMASEAPIYSSPAVLLEVTSKSA